MRGRPVTIHTKLKRGDREKLEAICRARNLPSVQAKRARALLLLSNGDPPKRAAEVVGLSVDAMHDVRKRYAEFGLERAVKGAKSPGASSPFTEYQRQQIIAIACSAPPPGASNWNCTLLAQEATARGIVDTIGRETIRVILNSHELKPWREKNVVRS